MSFEEKLSNTLTRTLPKLGPDVRKQLAAIIEPKSLAIMAGVLTAWAISHAFGVGEAIDIIIGALGVLSIGLAVFDGLDHLRKFAFGAYDAKTESDLETAAGELAKRSRSLHSGGTGLPVSRATEYASDAGRSRTAENTRLSVRAENNLRAASSGQSG